MTKLTWLFLPKKSEIEAWNPDYYLFFLLHDYTAFDSECSLDALQKEPQNNPFMNRTPDLCHDSPQCYSPIVNSQGI